MRNRKVFIAGVMQGNRKDGLIYSQGYRKKISGLLHDIDPTIEVIDPDKTDPERLNYSDKQAKKMFFKYCDIASRVNLLISYLPSASMGSAIEMWSAYNSRVPIIVISPLKNNWVIKLLSVKVYVSIKELIVVLCITPQSS